MDPEKALVPALAVSLPDSPTCILVQEFANHGLRNGVDDGRIGRPRTRGHWQWLAFWRRRHIVVRLRILVVVLRGDGRPLGTKTVSVRVEGGRGHLATWVLTVAEVE